MTAENLIKKIQQDMQVALKNRQSIEVSAIKSLMSRISNAEAIPQIELSLKKSTIFGASAGVGSTEAQRRNLSYEDILLIIQSEIEEIDYAIGVTPESSDYSFELKKKRDTLHKYLQ